MSGDRRNGGEVESEGKKFKTFTSQLSRGDRNGSCELNFGGSKVASLLSSRHSDEGAERESCAERRKNTGIKAGNLPWPALTRS